MHSVDGKLSFIIDWIRQVSHRSVFKLAITGLVHLDIWFPAKLVSENLLFFLLRRLHRESKVFLRPFDHLFWVWVS